MNFFENLFTRAIECLEKKQTVAFAKSSAELISKELHRDEYLCHHPCLIGGQELSDVYKLAAQVSLTFG